jgi:hypothetical protein
MAQRDRAALKEQATMEDLEVKSPASTAAMELSEQVLAPGHRAVTKERSPEEAELNDLRRQYKARYGFKPVGRTSAELRAAIVQFDRSVG